MKKIKFITGIFAIAMASFIVSCGGDTDDDINLISEDDTTQTNIITDDGTIEYAVPTPNELFEIIKLQGGQQKVGVVNSLDKKDNYVELKDKAMNFGVYSADLAYMSCSESERIFFNILK